MSFVAVRKSRPELALVAAGAIALLAGNFLCSTAFGQATLSPLTTFGSNGWLAPGSNPYLSTSNFERGIGWNPVTKNLVLPSRNGGNFVAILDGTSGALIKTMDTTGVSGGTLAMMGAGVTDDGAIYVPNLQSGSSALSPFKIYGWSGENDTNAPSVVFSQVLPQTTSGAFRYGDSFAVYGSGTSAKFASAGSTSSGTTAGRPNNSNFMIGSLDGSNTNTIYRNIPSTLTSSNDYRLSMAFVDADTVIGTQGVSAKLTDFVAAPTLSNTGATVTAAIATGAAARPLDYTVLDGKSLLALVDTNNSGISVYDITNPLSATLLTTGSTVVGTLALNGNGAGGLQWGATLNQYQQVVYAMSTNQGIQAMIFTVPEPSTYAMMGGAFAVIGVIASRKRRSEG
ncbi:MAG: PEP-CTERM sorting domain-containing protein [Planctomycetaceae bacterium]